MDRPYLSQYATVAEYKQAYLRAVGSPHPVSRPTPIPRPFLQAHVDHCERARRNGFLPLTRRQFLCTLKRVLH
jgi:hypothetical protein